MAHSMDMDATPKRPMWQRRWFQVLLAVLLGLVVLSFIVPPLFAVVYEVRGVLVPVLIGLGLAYVVNPAITAAHRRYRIPRWAGATAVMALGVLAVVTFLLLVVPPMIAQGTQLILRARDVYPQAVGKLLETAENLHLWGEPIPMEPGLEPGAVPGAAPEAGDARPAPLEPAPDAVAPDPLSVEPSAELSITQRLSDPEQRRLLIATLREWLQDVDWGSVAGTAVRSLDVGAAVVGGAISFTTYLLLAFVIAAFCFFWFAWKFDRVVDWFAGFVPASQREHTLDIVRQMDLTTAAFIRGRLVQAFVMMVILSTGWLIAGVPYWLLLGVLAGTLNLIPFVAVVGWLAALALTVIDQAAGPGGLTIWAILGPSIVYFIAQSIDGWVVEPVVQGKATNLDPLTVLLVVLIGGSLAGLLGMLLAIPTAACIKILAKEIVLPRLRELAAQN